MIQCNKYQLKDDVDVCVIKTMSPLSSIAYTVTMKLTIFESYSQLPRTLVISLLYQNKRSSTISVYLSGA